VYKLPRFIKRAKFATTIRTRLSIKMERAFPEPDSKVSVIRALLELELFTEVKSTSARLDFLLGAVTLVFV